MNRIIVLALLLALAPELRAQDPEIFRRANEAYKKGEFAGALGSYREIEKNVSNPDLYLNLGNAAYKAGQLGWAIVYFERGLRLAPRHADLEHNLRFVRERIVDKAGEEQGRLTHWLRAVHGYLSLDELLAIASALWIATMLLACLLVWKDIPFSRTLTALFSVLDAPKGSRIGALFPPLVLLLVLATVWTGVRLQEASVPQAVVLEKEVKATSGPGADSTVVFAVHEGTKVTIVRRSDRWAQVVLPNGFSGWVPESAIEEI